MKKTVISVTEAARNFADCVSRVRYQNARFLLLKNGAPVALLAPPEKKACSGADLARVLASARLEHGEAVAWSRDLKAARGTLSIPASRWQ